MAVVAIAGDDLVARGERQLHADYDRFLADIEMAESADQPHSVHLARLFLEAADQQHVAVGLELDLLAEIRDRGEVAVVRNRFWGVGNLLVGAFVLSFVLLGERH
jgi:hypothetical protein